MTEPNTPPSPTPGGAPDSLPASDLWAAQAAAPAPAAAGTKSAPASEPGWERAVLEKLAMASLAEQRAARRWKIFFRFTWLLLVVAIFWGAMLQGSPSANKSAPHTAVVDIKGEIASGAEASAEFVVAAMRSAFEDEGSKAVVLLINSPGGSPVQAGIINDEITRLKAKHNKPVYAVVEETCASAAYYIAAAADEIFVDKASIVGSIGVLMDGFGFTGTMEKLGVERRLLTAGGNKGFLDPFSPQSEEQTVHARQMLASIHEQFIKVVREGRGKRLKEGEDTFSGLMWTGEQSVAMGLADALGSVDSVARDVIKNEELLDYTVKENLAERFAKRFGAGAMDSLWQGLSSRLTTPGLF